MILNSENIKTALIRNDRINSYHRGNVYTLRLTKIHRFQQHIPLYI